MDDGRRPVSEDVLARISAIVGPKGLITDASDMAPYLIDQRNFYQGTTPMVVRPASTEEVAAVLAICHETGTAIVPQGGNTGLTGGSQPHDTGVEIIISTSRMNKVRAIDTINNTMTVEAGCILAELQQQASDADRLFP